MPQIIEDDLHLVWSAADTGPVLTASLVPLSNQGCVRVTYNWLYSSLNCDPHDTSPFLWNFYKLDDTHLALSPADHYGGKILYASVRDDIGWVLQVQAPYSADWITGIGRDEILKFEIGDLRIAWFKGFNDRYVTVNGNADSHNGHTGFRLVSRGGAEDPTSLFLVGRPTVLQPKLQFRSTQMVTPSLLSARLAARGVQISADVLSAMMLALS